MEAKTTEPYRMRRQQVGTQLKLTTDGERGSRTRQSTRALKTTKVKQEVTTCRPDRDKRQKQRRD